MERANMVKVRTLKGSTLEARTKQEVNLGKEKEARKVQTMAKLRR